MKDSTRTILTVFIAVFLGLCTLVFLAELYFSISALILPEPAPDAEIGESLGLGLSRAFLLVFFLIALVSHVVLTIIGEVLSILTARFSDGKTRLFAIIAAASEGVFLAVGIVLWFGAYL